MLNKIVFNIVTIFFTFFLSAYFLDIMSPMFPQVFGKVRLALIIGCHGQTPEGGPGGPDPPPLKNHKNRVSKQYWSRSPEK